MKTVVSIARTALLASLIAAAAVGCKKDDKPAPIRPTIENIEIGLNNSEIGVIGQDFHFECDVVAGDKIDKVQILILPRNGETYSKNWKHEIIWEYEGVKNTNIHKHFNIPEDAAEGKYDFFIIVNDENGTILEVKKSITIYTAANLPVNPSATIFNIFSNGQRYYRNGNFTTPGVPLKKNDVIQSQVTISNVKGDGKMYLLLINKKHNHRPEAIGKIDFTKAIVYDVYEHKAWANADHFSNSVIDLNTHTVTRPFPDMTIGGATDNNLPPANTIGGAKSWESGTYYFGVVYDNTTFKIGYFKYIEIIIEIE